MPLYDVYLLKMTVLIKAVIKNYRQQVNWLTRPAYSAAITLFYCHHDPNPSNDPTFPETSPPGLSWHRNGPSAARRMTSLACYTPPPPPPQQSLLPNITPRYLCAPTLSTTSPFIHVAKYYTQVLMCPNSVNHFPFYPNRFRSLCSSWN